MDSSGNAVADFGRFLTGFLVLMGVGKFVQSNAILLPLSHLHLVGYPHYLFCKSFLIRVVSNADESSPAGRACA